MIKRSNFRHHSIIPHLPSHNHRNAALVQNNHQTPRGASNFASKATCARHFTAIFGTPFRCDSINSRTRLWSVARSRDQKSSSISHSTKFETRRQPPSCIILPSCLNYLSYLTQSPTALSTVYEIIIDSSLQSSIIFPALGPFLAATLAAGWSWHE